jgi:hypothetical protein
LTRAELPLQVRKKRRSADPTAARARTRRTLEACQNGGGYCLSSGNSIANYVPPEDYHAMLGEGHLYSSRSA